MTHWDLSEDAGIAFEQPGNPPEYRQLSYSWSRRSPD